VHAVAHRIPRPREEIDKRSTIVRVSGASAAPARAASGSSRAAAASSRASASSHAQPYGRSNDCEPGRCRYATSPAMPAGVMCAASTRAMSGRSGKASSLRAARTSSQCMCTHECQS